MPEVYENQNWVVNAVESEDVYRQMQAAGQVNSNELYLVQGDDTDKYDFIVEATLDYSIQFMRTVVSSYQIIKGSYDDLIEKFYNDEKILIHAKITDHYADVQIVSNYIDSIEVYSMYGYEDVIKLQHTNSVFDGLSLDSNNTIGLLPILRLSTGEWN